MKKQNGMANQCHFKRILSSVPIASMVVLLVTVGLFSFGITGGHLHLDDWGYTVGCRFVKSGLSCSNIVCAFLDLGNGGIWMPFTYITFMADITFWGGGWKVHHAVNVVLHGLNAILVFCLLLRMANLFRKGKRPDIILMSLAGALIWSLHPMRAEAVVWVASRKEELWSLFALSASLCWIKFLESDGSWSYVATIGLSVLACFSKPTAVAFPLLAFTLQFGLFGLNRFRLRHYLPMLFISLSVGVIAVYSQMNPTGFDRIDISDTSFAWRVLNALVSLGLYLIHMVAPVGIHMDYRAVFGGWPLDGVLGITVSAIVVVVVLAFLTLPKYAMWRRLWLFACGWYVFSLMPVLGLFGVTGDKAYADRYSYLPSVVASLLIVVALDNLYGRLPRQNMIFAVFAVIVAEVVFAFPVICSFENDYLAYSRVLRYDPEHWRGLRVVGCEYCTRQDRMDEGIEMLRHSLELRPSQITSDRLAYSLACRGADGDFAEVRRLGIVAATDTSYDKGGMMLDALAIAAMREGDDASAARYFSAALAAPQRTHNRIYSMLNLGLVLANEGRKDEALRVLSKLHDVGNVSVKERVVDAIRKISTGATTRFMWR